MQGTWVQSLGQEDPLEKEMATHSNILALEIPWTEELSGLQFMGLKSQTQLSDCTAVMFLRLSQCICVLETLLYIVILSLFSSPFSGHSGNQTRKIIQ